MDVLKGELNSTSTYVPAQLTKDERLFYHINTLTKINVTIDNVNGLHFIGCQSYTKVLLNHASYQILATALLPFFQSTLHPLTTVKDHVMKYSVTAFSDGNVNDIYFIKKLVRSYKKVATA